MFKGFKIDGLKLSSRVNHNCELLNLKHYYASGCELYDEMKCEISSKLSYLKYGDNVLDATQIQSDWFPVIDADIFISHSHIDEKLAIAFAGWLKDNFGLTSFIDSCLWGYCNKLLLKIDKDNWDVSDGKHFDYEKRNKSTAIVHIILSNALTRMIDKTECLFFLDTSSSVPLKDLRDGMTYSPWIFNELEVSRLIKPKSPDRLVRSTRYFSLINESAGPTAAFRLMTDHLEKLSISDLKKWKDICNNQNRTLLNYINGFPYRGSEALDKLYLQKEIIMSK